VSGFCAAQPGVFTGKTIGAVRAVKPPTLPEVSIVAVYVLSLFLAPVKYFARYERAERLVVLGGGFRHVVRRSYDMAMCCLWVLPSGHAARPRGYRKAARVSGR
jgi:hypothetical protein